MDTVSRNLPEVKPTVVISVPRLFEKIFNVINKNVEEGSAVKQKIFKWALNTGQKYVNGKRGLVSLQKSLADKLVFDKLKEKTGGVYGYLFLVGRITTGYRHLFPVCRITHFARLWLTETSPVMTANRPGDLMVGMVGTVIPGVTVGIQSIETGEIIAQINGEEYPTNLSSEAGEILCKGPNVMKGYWRNDEATKEMIDPDGWLHTGDVGRFVDGYLKITDRIKHMLVNAGGKNIYPGPMKTCLSPVNGLISW